MLYFFNTTIRAVATINRNLRLLLLGLAVLNTSACGLKDDLYLPENQPVKQEPATTDADAALSVEFIPDSVAPEDREANPDSDEDSVQNEASDISTPEESGESTTSAETP